MRRIPTRLLHPGMRLAKRIYGQNGEVYLNAGVELTTRYIKRLEGLGFCAVYIEDRLLNGLEVSDVISEETRRHAVQQVKGFLGKRPALAREKAVRLEPGLVAVIDDIIDQLLDNPFSVVNLTDIRAVGEYLFHHSVNVCVLAVMAGITLGYARGRLVDLGTGALLHDIGKVRVAPQILNKSEALTREEFAEIQKHAVYGYEMLRDYPPAADIAYSHHERYSGGGYPRGLRGPRISVFAQLTGVADVFDALTSDRAYRKAQHPSHALELLSGAGGVWFEARLIKAFMENVAAYPTGTMVELNSGVTGVVTDTPRGSPFFPEVRVLLDAGGHPVTPYKLSTVRENKWVSRVLTDDETEALHKRLE